MPTKEVVRTVQPAHKSERITTARARKAWLAVESSARARRPRRAARTPATTGGAARTAQD